MSEYIVTYSGGEVDGVGDAWTNTSYMWDGDNNTYATNSVYTSFNTTIPYNFDYSNTYAFKGTDHDNTISSGTISAVYINLHSYSPPVVSGTIDDYYYGYMYTLISGSYIDWQYEFRLPTTSGQYTSTNITNIIDSWTWDRIDATDVEVYFDSGNYLNIVNLEVNSIKLRVITNV